MLMRGLTKVGSRTTILVEFEEDVVEATAVLGNKILFAMPDERCTASDVNT